MCPDNKSNNKSEKQSDRDGWREREKWSVCEAQTSLWQENESQKPIDSDSDTFYYAFAFQAITFIIIESKII